jgi:hypothetical protein
VPLADDDLPGIIDAPVLVDVRRMVTRRRA